MYLLRTLDFPKKALLIFHLKMLKSKLFFFFRCLLSFYRFSIHRTVLELRQYENDGIAEKRLFILNLLPFSLAFTVREKGRQSKKKRNSFGNRVVRFLYCLYSNVLSLFFSEKGPNPFQAVLGILMLFQISKTMKHPKPTFVVPCSCELQRSSN